MRKCAVCGKNKAESEYYFKKRSLGMLHTKRKDCHKEKRKIYMKAHYEKYGNAYRTRARIRKTAIKFERQQQLADYLRDKYCAGCGV